jgi:orotidine-5'-phosphate decarboxylase
LFFLFLCGYILTSKSSKLTKQFFIRKEKLMSRVPKTSWLFPEEQSDVVEHLLEWGLIKFDNERGLPLKSGGKTDVYINLRDARNTPEAIDFVANLFVLPVQHLGVRRFVEVPDSVSCFAGPLSIKTQVPYLTIREQEKGGRVANAKVIGHPVSGESVCIMDDVITNGASKIVPHNECMQLGLNNKALVVLVDRQQGWVKHLASAGINMPVWAGMTLHDVRRHLITTLGVMQRCSAEAEKKNPIIVALDGKNWDEIQPVVDRLRTSGCILKVNDLLFAEGIDHLLPNLSVYGRVMVDLKCHDIPNTVANTCKRLRPHAPWAVTVHGSGNKEMIGAAVKALEGTPTKVLVVTVLTSLDETACNEVYSRRPLEQVEVLADIADEAGAHGFVCSTEEVGELRRMWSNKTFVTPGIRSAGADAGDQKRIDTPKSAIDNGSNYLVMGRQIFGAEDPVAEVKRIIEDELEVGAGSDIPF